MKRENIAKISAVVITIALVAILLSQIQVADIITTLAGIDPLYLIAGFILYVCSYFFRVLRFHILLNGEVGIRELFNIVCVHNMVNNLLPGRTGELSFIYLLKKLYNKGIGESAAILIIARIFDFISISLLFFVSALTIQNLPNIIIKVVWSIAGFLAIIVLILIVLVYFGETSIKLIENATVKLNLNNRMIKLLLEKGGEIAEHFEVVQSKKVIISSFFCSIFIWGLKYGITYILLEAINIHINIWKVIAGSTFSVFVQILPIQSLGGFGIIESAWTIAYVPLGLPRELAITSAFTVHIVIVLYYCILGLIGSKQLKLMFSSNR